MNERRLSFEEMRDSLLSAAGQLDRTVGGRAGDLLSPQFARRTLYGSIDRQFLPSTLRVFDFANPDLHIPLRSETTVPQQALFFLNHPLMIGYAQALAEQTAATRSDEQRVQQMYRLAYQRAATTREVRRRSNWSNSPLRKIAAAPFPQPPSPGNMVMARSTKSLSASPTLKNCRTSPVRRGKAERLTPMASSAGCNLPPPAAILATTRPMLRSGGGPRHAICGSVCNRR